jgi:glycerophosphoryl diester phosphodiesterase
VKLPALLDQIRAYWRPFLAVHLLFTLLGITLLTPLFGGLLQGLLSLSGSAAVADQDIAVLLLTPLGALSGVLLVAVLMAITGLELAALQTVAQAARYGLPVGALDACACALRRAPAVLRLTLGFTLRVLLYLAPYLAAVGAVAWLLLSDHDINYYLSQRPTEFYAALGIAAVLTLLLVWFLGRRLLGWSVVLPLVLFSGVRPEESFRASERLTAPRRALCVRMLVTWVVLALLLGLVPALFLHFTTGAILAAGVDSLQRLLLLLGLTAAAWSVLGFLVAAFNLALLVALVAELYDRSPDHGGAAAIEGVLRQPEKRINPRRLAIALVLLAAVGAAGGIALLGDISVEDRALIVAHRGAAGAAPENTLASVERAVDDGADWVEIDVQESRDGQVVVVHDSDFMKLAGNPLKVWEGDLAEIRSIDVGSWFAPEFAAERVPTLREVLETVRGRSRLVIELKYYGHDQQLEQRVVDIVESMQMADQVAVMSLKLEGIEKLKALRPDWTAGLLAATAVGDLTRLEVDFLAVNQNIANRAFIKRARQRGKQVFVWTVNDGLSLSRWLSAGVDGVITDEPALARQVLAQRSELSSAERLLLSLATLFGKPEIARQYRDNSP